MYLLLSKALVAGIWTIAMAVLVGTFTTTPPAGNCTMKPSEGVYTMSQLADICAVLN